MKILILYKQYTIEEKIAYRTISQLKNTLDITALQISESTDDIFKTYDVIFIPERYNASDSSLEQYDQTFIEHIWNLGRGKIYAFAYSQDDRIIEGDNIKYILKDKILNILSSINNPHEQYIAYVYNAHCGSELLNIYDMEILQYFHDDYIFVNSKEEGIKLLKIIYKDRIQQKKNEIENIQQRLNVANCELEKFQNIYEKL